VLSRFLAVVIKNNPALIGEPGVGKTAIVEGLPNSLSKVTFQKHWEDKRLVTLDMGGIIAGTNTAASLKTSQENYRGN